MNNQLLLRVDWWAVLCYFILVTFGLVNIYSNIYNGVTLSLFDFSNIIGKQVWFFIICLIIWIPVLYINSALFENLAFILYSIMIILLLGLFVFGITISGATSWYDFGGIRLQPSEFSKIAVSLLIAFILSGIYAHLNKRQTFLKFWIIILLPALLIIAQPDPGSALVFMSLIFVFIREGGSFYVLILSVASLFIFILTILLNPINTSIGIALVLILIN